MKVDFDSQTLTEHIHHPLHDPSRIMQGALGRGRPSATPKSLPQLLQQVESEQPPSSGSDSVRLLLECRPVLRKVLQLSLKSVMLDL